MIIASSMSSRPLAMSSKEVAHSPHLLWEARLSGGGMMRVAGVGRAIVRTALCPSAARSVRPRAVADARRAASRSASSSAAGQRPSGGGTFTTALVVAAAAAAGAVSTFLLVSQRSPSTAPAKSDLGGAIQALKDALKDDARVSVDSDDLHNRGYSAWSYHPAAPPAVVVWPASVDECVAIVKIASRFGCAIVPFGGGTSLENHFSALPPEQARREGIPIRPTISVDFELMSDVLEYREDDGDVVVQPGLKWEDLNNWLSEQGSRLFWPIDPGPGASFGGMLSTAGSGTGAVRYGTMKGDYVLNVTVVLPSGEVITTRPRTRKFATSPDLTKLFLGAEGTLGLIVAATLRLAPRLPVTVGRATFDTVEDACGAVQEILAHGVGVQCIELLDDVMIRCVNHAEAGGDTAHAHKPLPEKPTLFIKFMGTSAHTSEDERLATNIVKQFRAKSLEVAREPAECDRLWRARKVALWSAMEYREKISLAAESASSSSASELAAIADRERESLGPVRCWTTDCCVPLGKLPEMVKRVKADIQEAGIVGPLVGHVGDGNVHALLVFRAEDHAEFEKVKAVAARMVAHAQSLGGTASGEHGVGLGKRQYVEAELGKGTVDLLRLLKRTIDPENIFNPGKLYPPQFAGTSV